MNIGNKIKAIREELKLTQSAFAKSIDLSQGRLSEIEKGRYKPSFETLISLKEKYNISLDRLVDEQSTFADYSLPNNSILNSPIADLVVDLPNELLDEIKEYIMFKISYYEKRFTNNHSIKPRENRGKVVPLAGRVAAGTPIMTVSEHDELIPVPENINVDFALTIKGDSMFPLLKDGSIVFIRKQETLENGEIGVFEIDSEVTCKRFRKLDDRIVLESVNLEYNPIIITDQEYMSRNFRVVGKVFINN